MKLRKVKTSVCPCANSKISEMTICRSVNFLDPSISPTSLHTKIFVRRGVELSIDMPSVLFP